MNHLHTLDICTMNRNIKRHYSSVFLRECTFMYVHNLHDSFLLMLAHSLKFMSYKNCYMLDEYWKCYSRFFKPFVSYPNIIPNKNITVNFKIKYYHIEINMVVYEYDSKETLTLGLRQHLYLMKYGKSFWLTIGTAGHTLYQWPVQLWTSRRKVGWWDGRGVRMYMSISSKSDWSYM